MQRLFLFVLLIVCSIDSFANDIAANVTNPVCDNDTLSQYNGTVNVEINWEPNVIDLRWYDGNTQLTPSNPASNSCTYDGDMYIPDAPTKTGYTFQGWRVRPQMDFNNISLDNFIVGYGKGEVPGSGAAYCGYYDTTSGSYEGGCNENSEFDDLQKKEWKAQVESGWLYGMAKCSAKYGDNNNTWNRNNSSEWTATESELDAVAGDKKNCWCKATGYKINGDDIIRGPQNPPLWACISDVGSESLCHIVCALRCGGYARYGIIREAYIFQ